VAHVTALGVEPIIGEQGRPTTQGKNERFHQTLFHYLAKLAVSTRAELASQATQRGLRTNVLTDVD